MSKYFASPRRRSSGGRLPYTRNNGSGSATITTGWDPFERKSLRERSSPTFFQAMQNTWINQSSRGRWLRISGIVIFIFLLYQIFFSKRRSNVYTTSTTPTAKCTEPYDLSRPLIQYVLVVDAGSTGSRIHVYKYNNCGSTPELEDEVFEMTEPRKGGSGLSSYKTDADAAARSLDSLMQVALRTVPDEYKSCSPIIVKATAGLRMLGEKMSGKILEAVRTRLETVYPFPVVSRAKGGVEIMSGDQEGVFAWITTNYLLGKIGGPDMTPTAAVFDLGGGSTQIVFQPTFVGASEGGMPETLAEGDHKYELDFGGRTFHLYQHSHLGYGLMSARESLHRSVLENMHKYETDSLWLHSPVPNACITPGMSRQVNVTFPEGHTLAPWQDVTMTGPAETGSTDCRALTEALLHKEETCNLTPCSFNGVHQPSFERTFAREDVYIFSYFYERTHELGMPESFTVRELYDLTTKVCGGEAWWNSFAGVEGALQGLRDRPEWCLDLNFISSLLRTGYEMPMDREVRIAKKIGGNEVGWCLGASLPLLEKESGWTCRVKEIS